MYIYRDVDVKDVNYLTIRYEFKKRKHYPVQYPVNSASKRETVEYMEGILLFEREAFTVG